MEYLVRLERLGSRPLAVVRRRAAPHELAKVVPDACGTVWNVIRGQQVAAGGKHLSELHEDRAQRLQRAAQVRAPALLVPRRVGRQEPIQPEPHADRENAQQAQEIAHR